MKLLQMLLILGAQLVVIPIFRQKGSENIGIYRRFSVFAHNNELIEEENK